MRMSTHAIGIDIIETDRVRRVFQKHPIRFINRVYTPAEAAFCRGRIPELAARFSGKEAVMKALGTGIRGLKWKDIEVLSKRGKAPQIILRDNALNIAKKQNINNLSVSLSHSKEYAIASVVGIKNTN